MNYKRINLVFNMKSDKELYDFLSMQTNKSAYVKEAISFFRKKHEMVTDNLTLKKVIKETLIEVLGNSDNEKITLKISNEQIPEEVLSLIKSLG